MYGIIFTQDDRNLMWRSVVNLHLSLYAINKAIDRIGKPKSSKALTVRA